MSKKICNISDRREQTLLGIANMSMTRLGPVCISPSALLVAGLQRELVEKLRSLINAPSAADAQFLVALDAQSESVRRVRRAFVFVCEHVGCDGVALWRAQLEAVVNEALACEQSKFEKVCVLLECFFLLN